MKFQAIYGDKIYGESRPARGAWVEMRPSYIEQLRSGSRPARGAWVEIMILIASSGERAVAPREGRVG